MFVSVVIASLGRPSNLETLLQVLAEQSRRPNQIILTLESAADLPENLPSKILITKVFGHRGMTAQRNRGLAVLCPDVEVVIFLDDDYIPSQYFVEGVINLFKSFPNVTSASGSLLADGARGPGITKLEGIRLVNQADQRPRSTTIRIKPSKTGTYGCNMAFRHSAIRGMQFDERLPLYGWLEDADFSSRVPGDCVTTNSFYGVHCGEKTGREKRGEILGFSQIVNPIYLFRKGSINLLRMLRLVIGPLAANHIKMLRPEPWIDRKGRALGNWKGVWSLIKGPPQPEYIRDMVQKS